MRKKKNKNQYSQLDLFHSLNFEPGEEVLIKVNNKWKKGVYIGQSNHQNMSVVSLNKQQWTHFNTHIKKLEK